MAMGRRKREHQDSMWLAMKDVAAGPGSPFYAKLNEALAKAGFDRWLEELCAKFYADDVGRPGIPPGIYFRMLMIRYFEGIGSERGIAWRCPLPSNTTSSGWPRTPRLPSPGWFFTSAAETSWGTRGCSTPTVGSPARRAETNLTRCTPPYAVMRTRALAPSTGMPRIDWE